jgi:hypothetical protein
MVRATHPRYEVTLLPLRTCSLRKKLLVLVDQNSASWNLIREWLRRLDGLRPAASV